MSVDRDNGSWHLAVGSRQLWPAGAERGSCCGRRPRPTHVAAGGGTLANSVTRRNLPRGRPAWGRVSDGSTRPPRPASVRCAVPARPGSPCGSTRPSAVLRRRSPAVESSSAPVRPKQRAAPAIRLRGIRPTGPSPTSGPLGGRAAEKLVFNHYTTGAGNDIEKATNIARKMVCEWGMSDKLGPLAYGAKEEEIFLGREIQKHRDYSEKTAIEIDDEVRGIINSAFDRAVKILNENMDLLHKLSAELLEREILDAEEIDRIIRGENLPPVQKEVKPAEDVVPDHVKKLMEQRQQQNTASNNDSH